MTAHYNTAVISPFIRLNSQLVCTTTACMYYTVVFTTTELITVGHLPRGLNHVKHVDKVIKIAKIRIIGLDF